jgi:tRNA threonylcarbamoyladenosine biosynthesis protein TsaE
MMKYSNLTLFEVKKLAAAIARQSSRKSAVIGLIGNLGSGKTTFAKAFAQSLGIKSLKSPTFIISQRYDLGEKYLYHMDFYRLDSVKQLEPLGMDEILDSQNTVLIEWVDKFPTIKKKCDILIGFKVKPDDKRDVTVKISNHK